MTPMCCCLRGVSLSEELSSNLYTHTKGNAQLLTLAIEALRQARHPERVIASVAETEDIERYLDQRGRRWPGGGAHLFPAGAQRSLVHC